MDLDSGHQTTFGRSRNKAIVISALVVKLCAIDIEPPGLRVTIHNSIQEFSLGGNMPSLVFFKITNHMGL